MHLPDRPPFSLRARVLTPLAAGGFADHPDGVVEVDSDGTIAWVGAAGEWRRARGGPRQAAGAGDARHLHQPPGEPPAGHFDACDVHRSGDRPSGDEPIDLRPLVVMPGLVDLHAHLPQLPNAGLGFGLDLLTWLERYIFPLERRWEDPEVAAKLTASAFRSFAAAGTTTLLAYGAVYKAAMDAAFASAEAHGIRAILGKVMMDRITYDEGIDRSTLIDRAVRESEELIASWHGADDGRLGYAVTPRFAVSCTAEMLEASAALAARTGAWWQTHVSEDSGEIAEVGRLFPEASDYVDVYDRAGGLGQHTVLAHAIHLSDREIGRLAETGTRIAHCPSSNLFLASGIMPLARYLEAGLSIGLGTDVAGGPEATLFTVMRVGAYAQVARRTVAGDAGSILGPFDWLRLGTLSGARALGLGDRIGSLEAGKEADIIAVDPRATVALPDLPYDPDRVEGEELVSRLIFRTHPAMVRGAWVRGTRLEGPTPPA